MSSALPQTEHPDDDRFTVHAPLEIVAILRGLQRNNALLKMHAEGSTTSIVTTILDIDRKRGQMTLDSAKEPATNQQLAAAKRVRFETQLNQVRIEFSTPAPSPCEFDGYPALRFSLPETVRRVQRREFYRIEPPISEAAFCRLSTLQENGAFKDVRLQIKDISAGGIALYDPEQLLSIDKGTTYKHCIMELPDVGEIAVDLCVERYADENVNEKELRTVGMSFHQPSGAVEMKIQHYIGMLERKYIARHRGF